MSPFHSQHLVGHFHLYQSSFAVWRQQRTACGSVQSDQHFYNPVSRMFVLLGLMLYIPVNSYGHVRIVSSPSHTFFLGKLDQEVNRYSKTCLKRPQKRRPKIGFQDQLSLNAGRKYCRMLQGEHSAILLTFIKLPFVIKIFVLSIFEWPLKTGFTVLCAHTFA